MNARLTDIDEVMFEPIFAVEHDPDAAETYALNFGPHVDSRPIQDVGDEEFPSADVLIGGPPCQGFSLLNRSREGDERRDLWEEYERALKATDAKYFVMENVPQLLASPELEDFRRKLGSTWQLTEAILNTADYGVPQTRRRAIVIGSRVGGVELPAATHAKPRRDEHDVLPLRLERGEAAPWVTVGETIGHLPDEPDGQEWHRSRNPTEKSRIRYSFVPERGGRFEMQAALDEVGMGDLVPACWRRKVSGTTDVFGRMRGDEPAPTLRTEFYKPEKGRYLHPTAHRPITVREGALLMSFPDDFRLPEHHSLTSIGRQIGNAVPPTFAATLGEVIAAHAVRVGLLTQAAVGKEAA